MSPALAALAIVLACTVVLVSYWRGLVYEPKAGPSGPMGGGGGAMPPPPLTGDPRVRVSTLAGNGESGLQDGTGEAARFDGPNALAFGPGGVLLVTDSRNHRLRQVSPGGAVVTVAGSGPTATVAGGFQDGPAATARLSNPSGLAVAPDGTVYFADTGNHRIRFLRGGQVGTLAGGDTLADETGLPAGGFADGPEAAARFRYPTSLARAADGSLLVVDTGNRKLRRVTPQGVTTTVADLGAAGAVSPFGLALAGTTVYVTDPGSARVFAVTGAAARPFAGPGGPAFWKLPTGVAAGPGLIVSDAGAHCLVALAGAPRLLAGVVDVEKPGAGLANGGGDASTFACPAGLLLAPDGHRLYVADSGNNCLRLVTLP
jgi:sugar lactone lactonase YvrE